MLTFSCLLLPCAACSCTRRRPSSSAVQQSRPGRGLNHAQQSPDGAQAPPVWLRRGDGCGVHAPGRCRQQHSDKALCFLAVCGQPLRRLHQLPEVLPTANPAAQLPCGPSPPVLDSWSGRRRQEGQGGASNNRGVQCAGETMQKKP